MKDMGNDIFTSNTPIQPFGSNGDFVVYWGKTVTLYTNVEILTDDEISALGMIKGSATFYKAQSYSFTSDEWNAIYDGKSKDNEDVINEILNNIIPELTE